MPEIQIESPDDPRLDAYRDLRHRGSHAGDAIIAEGEKLVLRLLESGCATESIVCNAAALDRLRDRIPAGVPVYVAPTPVISRLIGFKFHRGVLASGRRPPTRTLTSLWEGSDPAARRLVVLCPEIRDPENLGTIIRTAAAFGAAGLVAGNAGTNPFSRRVLRTSMGTVLKLPIIQTDDWPGTLETLHAGGFETIAAVVSESAEPLTEARSFPRIALLFGNEDEGLPEGLVERCRRLVTLPMSKGVNSLNVAVAAGIVIHHFAR